MDDYNKDIQRKQRRTRCIIFLALLGITLLTVGIVVYFTTTTSTTPADEEFMQQLKSSCPNSTYCVQENANNCSQFLEDNGEKDLCTWCQTFVCLPNVNQPQPSASRKKPYSTPDFVTLCRSSVFCQLDRNTNALPKCGERFRGQAALFCLACQSYKSCSTSKSH